MCRACLHDAGPSPTVRASCPEGRASPGTTADRGAWETVWAILRQRCPRCHRGRIFRGMFAMNDPCPVCGLLIQREEGYFLGALYISYPVSVAALTALFFAATLLLPTWNGALVALLAAVPYLPFSPAVFRYSRVLWIYLDRNLDPHGALTGAYEKARLKQLADGEGAEGTSANP